jgi:hypothetical protein
MTREQKQIHRWTQYLHAGMCLRAALVAFEEERNAKNGKAKRKASKRVDESLFAFLFFIYPTEGSLSKALHKIAHALDGRKPKALDEMFRPLGGNRFEYVPRDDIEKAVARTVGIWTKTPFSLREFCQLSLRLHADAAARSRRFRLALGS